MVYTELSQDTSRPTHYRCHIPSAVMRIRDHRVNQTPPLLAYIALLYAIIIHL